MTLSELRGTFLCVTEHGGCVATAQSSLIVSLLNLFIPQGSQVPINCSAVDSHRQYNYFYRQV